MRYDIGGFEDHHSFLQSTSVLAADLDSHVFPQENRYWNCTAQGGHVLVRQNSAGSSGYRPTCSKRPWSSCNDMTSRMVRWGGRAHVGTSVKHRLDRGMASSDWSSFHHHPGVESRPRIGSVGIR